MLILAMVDQLVSIPIEVAGLIVLLFVFVGVIVVAWITKKIAQWRYKPEYDKSKLGEEQRRANKPASAAISHIANQGHASVIVPGKDSISPREAAKSRFRALFQRAK